jgi:glycosyltransferase involved in cell wall biosynthesis
MKKINVLHLSSEKTWRGGEQQIAYLVSELEKMDVQNFVAVRKNSVFENHCNKKNIRHVSLPFKNSADIRTAFQIKKICTQHAIDLVHMHSSKSHGIGILSSLLGNKRPLILSRRVDFVPKKSWFTKWKYNHQSIKKILCVSDKINSIMRSYVARPDLCVTVHSGVDMNKFIPPAENILRKTYGLPSDVILIGNTSALEDHKDYFTFVNTIEELVRKKLPIRAFIVGRGSLEESLKIYVQRKSLSDFIFFTGFRDDINQVLPSLDIFLMTSKEEGLGTSILDAFLAGVPVVSTRAGGIPEMVIHEQTGMLAPIGDAQTLAAHIARIVSDTRFKNSLMEGAKQKVQEFSKERTAEKTLMLYQEVLASNLPDQGRV